MARVNELLSDIASLLNDLPGVFSTPQWGGRAYKLPGANGNPKKPKLLAFVTVDKDSNHVAVVFKLPKSLSDESIERFEWVEPFKFGNWKKSGWIEARIRTKRQIGPLRTLLKECRGLFPAAEEPSPQRPRTSSGGATNAIAQRIDRVLKNAVNDGWSPPPEDESFTEG